jgi:hypothetical protein
LLLNPRLVRPRCHPPQRRLLADDPAVLLCDPAVLGVQLGIVQRDSELGGDEVDRVEPPGRERGADQRTSDSSHSLLHPIEDERDWSSKRTQRGASQLSPAPAEVRRDVR